MCGSCYYLLLVSSHKHEKQKDQRGRGERRSMLLKTHHSSYAHISIYCKHITSHKLRAAAFKLF